ncbi:MAG: DUF6370 family protein [Ferruginibacter sp.]
MKGLFMAAFFSFSLMATFAQNKVVKTGAPDKNKKLLIVETACGQCKLGLPGNSCNLAIRINGQSYFVDGTDIDSHGDAHASDGFCNAIRMAKVQGEIIDKRFKATYFQLLPETSKEKKKD